MLIRARLMASRSSSSGGSESPGRKSKATVGWPSRRNHIVEQQRAPARPTRLIGQRGGTDQRGNDLLAAGELHLALDRPLRRRRGFADDVADLIQVRLAKRFGPMLAAYLRQPHA